MFCFILFCEIIEGAGLSSAIMTDLGMIHGPQPDSRKYGME